jgi:hypothetical protein
MRRHLLSHHLEIKKDSLKPLSVRFWDFFKKRFILKNPFRFEMIESRIRNKSVALLSKFLYLRF